MVLARLVWPASRLDELEGEERALSVLWTVPTPAMPVPRPSRHGGSRASKAWPARRTWNCLSTTSWRRGWPSSARAACARRCAAAAPRFLLVGARTLPPSVPRRERSVQGDGRPASPACDRRAARLPERSRRVCVRGRGRARGRVLLTPEALRWRDRDAGAEALARVRREQLVAVGSCSFFEPVDELGAGDPVIQGFGTFTRRRRAATRLPFRRSCRRPGCGWPRHAPATGQRGVGARDRGSCGGGGSRKHHPAR